MLNFRVVAKEYICKNSSYVTIEANDEEEAREIAKKMYKNGQFVFSPESEDFDFGFSIYKIREE